jgi:hypothetical protein
MSSEVGHFVRLQEEPAVVFEAPGLNQDNIRHRQVLVPKGHGRDLAELAYHRIGS